MSGAARHSRAVVLFRPNMLDEPEVLDLPPAGKLALIESILEAAAAGDREFIEACPYVGGVRWGRRDDQPVTRLPVPYRVRQDVLSAGRCAACGVTDPPFEIDHIIPHSRGGTHARANLQLLCKRCNRDKGALTMEEWRS